jgi:hypothetical protein|tara:strand:+ start:1636 stop:1788 length:153 start_codon:yes stop_codon:yes gene_type:complete
MNTTRITSETLAAEYVRQVRINHTETNVLAALMDNDAFMDAALDNVREML